MRSLFFFAVLKDSMTTEFMSVRYGTNQGRIKRTLKTPAYTMLKFHETESKAMSPKHTPATATAILALLGMITCSTLSIYGVFASKTEFVYIGLVLMAVVSFWVALQLRPRRTVARGTE